MKNNHMQVWQSFCNLYCINNDTDAVRFINDRPINIHNKTMYSKQVDNSLTMDSHFTDEQKRYLEGFTAGIRISRTGISPVATPAPETGAGEAPEQIHIAAQDRIIARGGKLSAEEKAKREKHPLDRWDELTARAAGNEFPKGTDVFCTKFFGLFYVAPAQDSYMCRLRIHNGILNAWQLRGIADIAERCGGGYSHVTTRANLQIREIGAKDAPDVVTSLQDLGITTRGSGGDNIRNVTGSPTAGIDAREIIDTRPLARELHHHILNHRDYYGLPRKFNIAFDGGGAVSNVEDSNDIGFTAVNVPAGGAVEPGVYFHLLLGGISGHETLAAHTHILVKPEECIPVCDAILKVFIDNGDRTDRAKARLKYLIDAWGLEKFLDATEQRLPFRFRRAGENDYEARGEIDRFAHVGFHPQRQDGLYYAGVVLPVGKLSCAQMRGLADIAQHYGDGDIRLTVWQNLLLSGINSQHIKSVQRAIESLGLEWQADSIRAGLIACTGNSGCKFAAADTKYHTLQIARHVEKRIALDQPVNIHVTGCHHSCAQHYIGDIGLIACKITQNDDEDEIEGYHIYLGGSCGRQQRIATELARNVAATEAPRVVEAILRVYMNHRTSAREDFLTFVSRHPADSLLAMMEEVADERAA